MNSEERFLRDATRGLPRHARTAAQAELRSHIHERASQLQLILGSTAEAEARAQAMRELGPPRVIARSLNRHVHPLLSALTLTALAGLVALPIYDTLGSQWRQGLSTSSASSAELRADGYINMTEARQLLKTAGIGLERRGETFYLTHAGLPEVTLDDWDCAPTASERSTRWEGFVTVSSLLFCTSDQWPLQVEGRSIRVRGQTIPVDLHENAWMDWSYFASDLYSGAIRQAIKQLPQDKWLNPFPFPTSPTATVHPLFRPPLFQAVRLPMSPGTPVALIVKTSSTGTSYEGGKRKETVSPVFQTYVAWAGENGVTRLPKEFQRRPRTLPLTKINILTDLNAWQNAPLNQGAAIVIPLGKTTADPVKLTPLQPIQ